MVSQIDDILKIINQYDPINLLDEGCPIDEYIPEAQMIFSAWNDSLSFNIFHQCVYSVFKEQFRWILQKSDDYFLSMSRDLWSYLKMNESV